MKPIRTHSISWLLAGLALLFTHSAFAQATRTWVSGVGDDANPCSRTAPCKTFAGAISKTAAGGVISVLDPGGFGAVTITKAITIDGTGTFGSITAPGTTGIVVNAGVNDEVTIRNIAIYGANTGINGIRYIGGRALHVDGVHISGFKTGSGPNANGILVNPNTAVVLRLYVSNSTIINNGQTTNGGGINLIPSGTAAVNATIEDSRINANLGYGVKAYDFSAVAVSNSMIAGNKKSGLEANSAIGGYVNLSVRNSVLDENAWDLAAANAGVLARGAAAEASVSGSVFSNNQYAFRSVNSGVIYSGGDNKLFSNGTNGSVTGPIPQL